MRKICIIYNIPHHYRVGIWRELSKSKSDDFKIYCGYDEGHSVKHIEKEKMKCFNPLGELKIFPVFKNIYFKQVLIFQKNLLSLIFSKKFDNYIFFGEYYSLSTWISIIYLKLRRRNVIIWTHGVNGREGYFKKQFIKKFYSIADHLLLYGNYAKNILKNDYNYPNTSVVYNSLDLDAQLDLRTSINKQKPLLNQKYIIFIGRIEKRKRIDLLLKAYNILLSNNRFSSLNLVIIGDGTQLDNLKKKYSDPKIHFLGAVYEEGVIANYLYNAQILVSPGHVGLNVMHALTYGTPVITHDNFKNHAPEFEAIIQKKTGDFFEENSLTDLTKVVMTWLDKDIPKDSIRNDCFKIIDRYYNPVNQARVIKKLIYDN